MAHKVSPPRARTLFERSYAELERVREEQRTLGPDHPLNKAFEAAVLREVQRFKLRGKIADSKGKVDLAKAATLLGKPVFDRIKAPFEERATLLGQTLRDKAKAIEARLSKLADDAIVVATPGGPWLDFAWHSEYTYSTQTDASGYARGRAEIDAAALRELHGIQARVEKRNRVYFVEARVQSELDLAILRYRSGFSLREFVRRCWAQARNPRVYEPFLPHGYEQREGIDYQGRDLRKVTT